MSQPILKTEHTSFRRPINQARYSDRACSPSDTLDRIRPHFAALGITRIAQQTGLDNIGIPCFAAIRPNSMTLAANQGKGANNDAAMASAAMEAFEYAIAENPHCARRTASIRELQNEGCVFHWPDRLLPGNSGRDEDRPLTWVTGFDHFTGDPVLVPYDAVAIGQARLELNGICASTNGLASGNTRAEAAFHALCELIERDASSLMAIGSDDTLRGAQIRPEAFDDPMIDDLVRRIHAAGCAITLFDLTTNLGVPVIEAVIFDDLEDSPRHFDLSAGVGCHPVAVRAAIRAITEAAQTRITNIAGSRDDIRASEYRFELDPSLVVYRAANETASRRAPLGCELGTPLPVLAAFLNDRLSRRKVNEIIVVPLGGEVYGGSVVKVLAPRLEDRAPNHNWRPGPRALSSMMRAI